MSINIKQNVRPTIHKYFYLLLIIPLLFIAYPLFSNPGIPIGNGDLPYIEISLYSFKKFWTWNEYGSYHGLETLPRYPIIAAFQLINILPSLTSKLLIVGGFAIASLSFYFSFIWLFKNRVYSEDLRLKVAAILGSLFYAYNVWSFQRLGHWYFWLGYAILPLFFVTLIYTFRNPRKWKYVLVSVLLWSVASSTPHMAVFFGIIFVGLSAIFVTRHIKKNHNLKIPIIKPFSLILVAYVFINLYWIYPYLVSSTSESFLWSAVVTEEITRDLSQESDFLNVFRLLEGTFNMGIIDVVPSHTSALYPFWLIASFVPPIVAFSSVIWRKSSLYRYILFFLATVVIGIFLTMGTNAPLNIYSVLLFYTPLTSYLQILLREPDKWGFLVSFGYSFLIAISTFIILNKLRSLNYRKWINTKNVLSICFVFFTLSSIVIYFFPAYADSMYDLYHPVILPDDFGKLQENLRYSGANRVFVTPYSPSNTTWVKNIGTFDLYHVASPVPNIAAYDYNNVEKYHKFLIDSIITNKTNKIDDIIYPLGTPYLLFHNDTIVPLNKNLLHRLLSTLDGVKFIDDFGFFKLFETGNNEKEIPVVNIPMSDALIVGGLHQLSSLSSIESFNSVSSTLVFLDQKIKNRSDEPILNNAKYIILYPAAEDFILSFIDEEYIIEPFHATNHHEPKKLWSKAGADDPGNAWFTPYLEYLGMHNSDFDYGKGLVITEAMGAKLSMPLHTRENGDYEIFVRYLNNQKGGMIKLYLDNVLIDKIYTKNARTNNDFVWKKIAADDDDSSSPLYLKEGKHILTLENVAGFNAVNLFAVIPPEQRAGKLEADAYSIANKTRNVYILEAESNFYNNKGRNDKTIVPTIHKLSDTITGQIKVPVNADLASFTILENDGYLNSTFDNNKNNDTNINNNNNNNNNNHLNSGYSFKTLELSPINQTTELFRSDFEIKEKKKDSIVADFENNRKTIPLATLRQISPKEMSWREAEYSDLSVITIDQNTPISGNASLRVDIKKANTLNWNVISSDFIELDNESQSIEASMAVSTKDVNQLHSKLIYYDRNKNQIASDFFFGGRDGTFKENFISVHIIPPDTKYVKMQMLARTNPTKTSSYIIDDTKVLPLSTIGLGKYDALSNTSIDQNTPISGNASLRVDIKKANTLNWNVISSDFIPVNDQSYYKLSLNISAENVNQLHPKISYYNENKKQITNLNKEPLEEIVFPGIDGDFRRGYNDTPLLPLGTKYIKLQILAHPNPKTDSIYWIDDMTLKEIMPESVASSRGNFESAESAESTAFAESEEQKTLSQMQQLEKNVSNGKNNQPLSEVDVNNDSNRKNSNAPAIIHQTKPISVKENGIYNYTITVERAEPITKTKTTNDLKRIVQQYPQAITIVTNFGNSSDIIENSTKYGAKASAGSVLSLSPGSEIYADLDVLKAANYTIALRAGSSGSINNSSDIYSRNNDNTKFTATDITTNNDNSSLIVSIIQKENDDGTYYKYNNNKLIKISSISFNNNKAGSSSSANINTTSSNNNDLQRQQNQELQWLYLNNTYLDPGKYEIRISSLDLDSNSIIDLDSVIIYSTYDKHDGHYNNYYSNNNDASNVNMREYETLEEVFDSQNISPPAYIEQYKKIDPTKYEVEVKNATRPYIMSLAESYDPLWTTYVDNEGDDTTTTSTTITTTNSSPDNKDNHNFKALRVPLYSIINGFYINKTGDYTLTIEYEPQKWFIWAGIISIIALILSVIFLILQEKKVHWWRQTSSKKPISFVFYDILNFLRTAKAKRAYAFKLRRLRQDLQRNYE